MIDLQHALRLYRRQGAVASQDKHLGRSLVSEPYPAQAKDTMAEAYSGMLRFEFHEIIKPDFVESIGAANVTLSIIRKDTTVKRDLDFTEAIGAANVTLSITRINTTTNKVDLDPFTEAIGATNVTLRIVRTPEAIDTVQKTTVEAVDSSIEFRRL